jgi:hypothetical protein
MSDWIPAVSVSWHYINAAQLGGHYINVLFTKISLWFEQQFSDITLS